MYQFQKNLFFLNPVHKSALLMNRSIAINSMLLILVLLSSSFRFSLFHDFQIKYSIKGVYHNLDDGITKAEFNELTLTTNQELKVESFTITLSRGNGAVKIIDVNSNKFNLRTIAANARSGDYIVIEVKKLSGERHSKNALFKAIKVI